MADLTSAYIGLVGVFVGGALAIGKDVVMHLRSEAKDSVFLSIQVMALLEKFADDCTAVANDEGDWDHYGQHYMANTQTPDFTPSAVDVQWKTLPPLLLYRIMDLPHKVMQARALLANIEEFASDPPEEPELFEERRIQFAELGIEALDLASTLRLRSGIPQRHRSNGDPSRELQRLKDRALEDRAVRLARAVKFMHSLNSLDGGAQPSSL